jgi:plasmid stability protein
MKAITLRNLPTEVARTVQRRAKQKKTSVNKAVIELLEESAGGAAKKTAPVRYHDLDHLAGTWTTEEAAAFEQLIAEQRTIDPELWK